MKYALTALILLALALPASAEETPFWNDGNPEVILGAYFDEAGTDSIFEGEISDSLTVYLVMWNGGTRNEGGIRALEYRVELPDGLMLMRDDLPDYSNLAMGTLQDGFTQAVKDKYGDGLLINTLTLFKVGEIPFDARIRIRAHPVSGFLRYVHGKGAPDNVDVHMLQAQDGILNPKLTRQGFKPVRSH